MPTITVHPAAVLASQNNVKSIDSSHPLEIALGKGTNNSTYAQWYMVTGAAAQTEVHYSFDLSAIPENATISSVTCSAKCQCQNSSIMRGGNNTISLFSDSNRMTITEGTTAFGTTATTVTIPAVSWTREQLEDCSMKITGTRGFLGTSTSYYMRFYGADLTVTYEVPAEGTGLYFRSGGVWTEAKALYVRQNGVWTETDKAGIQSLMNSRYYTKE